MESEPDSAWEIASFAGQVSDSIGWPRGKLNSFQIHGQIADQQNSFVIAVEEFGLGYKLAKESGIKRGVVILGANLAHNLQKLGNYPQAFEVLTEVIEVAEATDFQKGLGSAFNTMAILLKAQGNLRLARKYYRNALAIHRDQGDLNQETNTTLNYALTFDQEAKIDSMEFWARRAIKLSLEGDYAFGLAHARTVLSQCMFVSGKTRQAFALLRESKELYRSNNNLYSLAGVIILEGSYRVQSSDFGQGIKKCAEAELIGAKLKSLELQKSACLCQANGAEGLKNYQDGLKFTRKARMLEDSLTGLKIKREMGFLEKRFQAEQKERKLLELSIDLEKETLNRERKEVELERGEIQRNYLFLALALLILGAGLLTLKLLGDRKTARLEAEKRALAERSVKEKELLVKEIHHRVKNNLQVIYNLLDLQARSLKDSGSRAAISESRDRVASMALVHRQLYGGNSPGKLQLNVYLPALLDQIEQSYGRPEVTTEVRALPLELDLDQAIPLGLIVNELVVNSFKYAFPTGNAGCILVEVVEKGEFLELTVSDNGHGFSGEIQKNFGLSMVKSLTRQLRGELEYSGEKGFVTRLLWQPKTHL